MMLRIIKQLFIALLSFRSPLATKCLPFNDEPCMVTYTLIDLNPVEFEYYPFMVSLAKRSGGCNSGYDLFIIICVQSKTKDVHVKAFNVITNRSKAKHW